MLSTVSLLQLSAIIAVAMYEPLPVQQEMEGERTTEALVQLVQKLPNIITNHEEDERDIEAQVAEQNSRWITPCIRVPLCCTCMCVTFGWQKAICISSLCFCSALADTPSYFQLPRACSNGLCLYYQNWKMKKTGARLRQGLRNGSDQLYERARRACKPPPALEHRQNLWKLICEFAGDVPLNKKNPFTKFWKKSETLPSSHNL